jgi:hypothetical protein
VILKEWPLGFAGSSAEAYDITEIKAERLAAIKAGASGLFPGQFLGGHDDVFNGVRLVDESIHNESAVPVDARQVGFALSHDCGSDCDNHGRLSRSGGGLESVFSCSDSFFTFEV